MGSGFFRTWESYAEAIVEMGNHGVVSSSAKDVIVLLDHSALKVDPPRAGRAISRTWRASHAPVPDALILI